MAETLKSPKQTGVAKVPIVIQMEALECGAAALAMVLAYYNKWVPLEQARYDCGISRDGSNLRNIYVAATNYGMKVRAFRMEPDMLKEKATFPCIIHWNFNHFVVLNGFKKDKAVINDPARGTVQVPMEEFDKSFTGPCLLLEPGEDFQPSGKRKSTLAFARKQLVGAGAVVAFVAITTIISYLFTVINPVMSRIFYDRLLTKQAPHWVYPFFIALAFLCVIQIVVEWAKAIYTLKINGKMSIEGNASFMWKLLHLPMNFFSQRMTGDLMQRQASNATISGIVVDTVGPLALNTIMMVFYLVVMLRYSVLMTAIGLVSLALDLLFARIMSNKRVSLMRIQMRDYSKLSSSTLAGISMNETIRASGAEGGFFRKWSGYQASVNTQNVRFTTMNTRLGIIPELVSTVSNYAVLFLGVFLAMQGSFTLGMIVTFQGLLSSFMGPASTLITAGQTIQEMRSTMERVEDVMEYPDDPFVKEEVSDDISYEKLKGMIDLQEVSFGYARFGEPVISDFSMHLEPGKSVAIVGMSGCGKSTVSKLIAGLIRPWSGEIRLDGKEIGEIPRGVFTGSVAMVDQDITLFEDTIANNIRLWDKSIADFEVVLAARDAQIHDDILKRPGGYQGKLIENGRDLSGGQRQRLEIARVLAQDPSVIILDEATSAMDAKTEYEVVRAIKERNISCVVVAHRLSTIRDCDEIIVLDNGRIAERGTHKELYALGGLYKELITSE